MTKFKMGLVAVLLTTLITLPATAAVHNVTVRDFSFTPAALSVSQGDTVVWTNVQGFHNVHHVGNPSLFGNSVGSGWVYTFVFNLPAGRYDYVCEPHAPGMAGSVTVVPAAAPERPAETPREVALAQNYPNPFNGVTQIEFTVPVDADARLVVLNVLGQEVARPFSGRVAAGQHRVAFDPRELSGGIYFYRLDAAGASVIRTMHYVK